MKNIYTSKFRIILFLFFLGTVGCSKDPSNDKKENGESDSNGYYVSIDYKSIYGDVLMEYDGDDNIQADYGYSGAGIINFDIGIHDYSPQTFSIGFVKAVNSTNYEPRKSYNVSTYFPIVDDTPIVGGNAQVIINEDYENAIWLDTSLKGEGRIEIINYSSAEEDFIVEFDYTCYATDYTTLTQYAEARIKGRVQVKKRIH